LDGTRDYRTAVHHGGANVGRVLKVDGNVNRCRSTGDTGNNERSLTRGMYFPGSEIFGLILLESIWEMESMPSKVRDQVHRIYPAD
jgi:hypothetical protein